MKTLGYTAAAILFVAATSIGGPLRTADVAADAKWVLHLDVDRMRSTWAGNFVITNIADKLLAQPKAILKQDTGYELDLNKVRSITAYGNDSSRVMLLKADLDAERVLDGALARIQKAGQGGSASASKAVEDGRITYRLRDRLVVTLVRDKVIIASQSAEANQEAANVLSGKSPNLGPSPLFKEFPEPRKGFFFLGLARGFNADAIGGGSRGGDENNPKARILRMADGGRIVLGQDDDQLFLNVALKAKESAVVTQMQQVIQGMIALAALAQSDNTNIQQLAESAKVTAKGEVVSLSLSFPADRAVAFLQDKAAEKLEQVEKRKERERETNEAPESNQK
ncbi:MAG TPA: hypothetical protein VHI52_21710 [Verrucomicrobiae bacterium]|nr:hypothetical protein [Verrucomicrobiae bacterium]